MSGRIDNQLKGFQTLWTAPSRAGLGPSRYGEFEALSVALSAGLWRRLGGSLVLFTDPIGKAWIEQYGLRDAYDEIDTSVLEGAEERFDSRTFWAGGKFLAWEAIGAPALSLDWDLFAFQRPEINWSYCVQGLHWDPATWPEYTDNQVYQRIGFEDWDFLAKAPVNAALLGIYEPEFLREYTVKAKDFMAAYTGLLRDPNRLQGSEMHSDNAWGRHPMMFIEQRMITALAQRRHLPVGVFETIPEGQMYCMNDRIYHLWSVKDSCYEVGATRQRYADFMRQMIGQFGLNSPLSILDRTDGPGTTSSSDFVRSIGVNP